MEKLRRLLYRALGKPRVHITDDVTLEQGTTKCWEFSIDSEAKIEANIYADGVIDALVLLQRDADKYKNSDNYHHVFGEHDTTGLSREGTLPRGDYCLLLSRHENQSNVDVEIDVKIL